MKESDEIAGNKYMSKEFGNTFWGNNLLFLLHIFAIQCDANDLSLHITQLPLLHNSLFAQNGHHWLLLVTKVGCCLKLWLHIAHTK